MSDINALLEVYGSGQEVAEIYHRGQQAARDIADKIVAGESHFEPLVDHAIALQGAYDPELVAKYQAIHAGLAANVGQLVVVRATWVRQDRERVDSDTWLNDDLASPRTVTSVGVQSAGEAVLHDTTSWGIPVSGGYARVWRSYSIHDSSTHVDWVKSNYDDIEIVGVHDEANPGIGEMLFDMYENQLTRTGRQVELILGDQAVEEARLSTYEKKAVGMAKQSYASKTAA